MSQAIPAVEDPGAARVGVGPRLRSAFAFQKIGGLYVLAVMIVIFSIWLPDTFPHWATVQQVLNNNAISAMAALTLVVPLSAGVFDISATSIMTLSGVICAYSVVNTGLPLWLACVFAMVVSIAMGIVNCIVVVWFKIDSLIGTLATGFIFKSVVQWRANNRIITSSKLAGGFSKIGRKQFLALTTPVYFTILMAFVIWYLLEHTATGRRIYATGFNRDAARLAGVGTQRIQIGSLLLASTFAGFVGIVLASNIGSGSPTAADNKLLPAFAGVFLGATQLKGGRFNAWGTLIGVVMLATLTVGLSLAGKANWFQDLSTGLVLIAALAVTSLQVRSAGGASLRSRFLRRGRG